MKSTLFLTTLIVLIGCKKQPDNAAPQDAGILTYSIEGQAADIQISKATQSISITFPDSVMNADNLIADFTLSEHCKARIKNIEQISGVSRNSYAGTFFYAVSAPNNTVDWKVTSRNNAYTSLMGLGNFIQETASNGRSYSWYLDQIYTGPYSSVNCGPTAVTMACKWADSTFSKTPEDARAAYRPGGGFWYTDDIRFYLRDNHITSSMIALGSGAQATATILKRQIDARQIVILCLDMNLIRFAGDGNFHCDRFYPTTPEFGHCIIVKGYKRVDNETFFEVYDPNSWSKAYGNGDLMGRDRYYRVEDLYEATKSWWPYGIIVAQNGAVITERGIYAEAMHIPVRPVR